MATCGGDFDVNKESDSESGYVCSFISEVPDALLCLICTFPARDPQQVDCCGRLFCKFCLDQQRSKFSAAACPNCRSKKWEVFPDKRGGRDILSLKVKCDLNDSGCHWEGELRSLEGHLKTCSRDMISCVYSSVGCKETFLKRKLEEHNSSTDHLAMAVDRIRLLSDRLNEMGAERRLPPVVFKLNDFQLNCNYGGGWNSPPFYTHPKGYKLYLKVSMDLCEYVSVYACLMHGEHDEDLVWPFRGVISFEILNQKRDSDHKEGTARFLERKMSLKNRKVTADEGSSDLGWGVSQLLCINGDLSSDEDSDDDETHWLDYLDKDNLYIRVSQVTVSDMNRPWLIS